VIAAVIDAHVYALLANTLSDPNVLSRAARRLDQWIDKL
jgi:hypothetical protein